MPVCAGAFDRRISILRSTPAAKNGLGEKVPSWAVVFTCWASRNYKGGLERKAANATAAVNSALFTVRYAAATASITTKDRLRYKGKDYNIISAEEYGFNETIDIIVEGAVP